MRLTARLLPDSVKAKSKQLKILIVEFESLFQLASEGRACPLTPSPILTGSKPSRSSLTRAPPSQRGV